MWARMRAPARLAAYAALLAVLVGGGAAVGAAAGPVDVAGDDVHNDAEAPRGSSANQAADLPGGLAVAHGGYRLVARDTALPAGVASPFSFEVVGDDGTPETRFALEHEKRLHLVVVGRNLVDYAHVHPTMTDDGTWTVELPPLPAGSYRAFADFRPSGGDALTLGADLTVTGPVAATEPPAPERRSAVDGYDVALDGQARRGESELGFTVRSGGETVSTDPYLGAAGHLVAIRQGDLAYLHVHPLHAETDQVRFAAEFPTAGTYRLFFDFSHGGQVRTAAFTVEVPDDGSTAGPTPTADDHDGGH
jgi:hypothetical protein